MQSHSVCAVTLLDVTGSRRGPREVAWHHGGAASQQNVRHVYVWRTGERPSSISGHVGAVRTIGLPSDGLLVDGVAAIASVMKPCKRKGRRLCGTECRVHVQCTVLDKEEMLGYLLGDVLGLGILPKPYARPVGEAARLRATKVAPAIRAAPQDPTLRSKVAVCLPLPTQRQCAGAAAAAKKPTITEPAVTEPADRVKAAEAALLAARAPLKQLQRKQQVAAAAVSRAKAAWNRALAKPRADDNWLLVEREELTRARDAQLQADDAIADAEFGIEMAELELESAKRDALRETLHTRKRPRLVDHRHARCRLWQPRSAEERAVLLQRLEIDRSRNDLCSCDDPRVPSWLCRVAACWSTGAGCPCPERLSCIPGDTFCTCMIGAWSETHEGRSLPPDALDRRARAVEGYVMMPSASNRGKPSLEQAAAEITSEELSEWCLSNCYPDPYQRGQSVLVPGRGVCIFDTNVDGDITSIRFV